MECKVLRREKWILGNEIYAFSIPPLTALLMRYPWRGIRHYRNDRYSISFKRENLNLSLEWYPPLTKRQKQR